MRADLRATVAAYTRSVDLNMEAVILADDRIAPTWQLEVQRTLVPDAQDRALGMDTYCVVLPSGASSYGSLEFIEIGETLRLRFLPEAVETLGLPDREIDVPLELPPHELDEFLTGLRSILGQAPNPPTTAGVF
jgi:hypothetical protein